MAIELDERRREEAEIEEIKEERIDNLLDIKEQSVCGFCGGQGYIIVDNTKIDCIRCE